MFDSAKRGLDVAKPYLLRATRFYIAVSLRFKGLPNDLRTQSGSYMSLSLPKFITMSVNGSRRGNLDRVG
jgi:hypothetical protein